MEITVREAVQATGGELLNGGEEILNLTLKDVCIDSRIIKAGDLFIPIVGEKVDAHKFIPDVMKKGTATFTEKDIDEFAEGKAYIKVPSTVKALQDIGRYVRLQYKNPVVGVTGSVGKTTTREMITTALSSVNEVFHTEGNFNSEIGLPITTSRMTDKPSDIAVLEMGISAPGEMDILSHVGLPDIAVVTMIGVAHIEFLKTKEGIRDEKIKICKEMNEDGVLFLNADDPLLAEMKGKTPVKTFFYGTGLDADYRAEDIRVEDGFYAYTYCHGEVKMTVRIPVLGKHNVLNSLVAMAICDYLDINLSLAARALEDFHGLRQTVMKTEKGYTLIDDTYNASPDSMKAAIDVVSNFKCSGKKYIVLGDMFELGVNEAAFHTDVGSYFEGKDIDELITIGQLSLNIESRAREVSKINTVHLSKLQEVTDYLNKMLKKDDIVLLKASNGMHLSEVVKEID